MNAREVTRVMMGFEAKHLEAAREHIEAAAMGLHIPELFAEGKDE